MWYLGSLFVLIVFLLASAIVGGAVCKLLPWRIRPHATVAFAPIFGLAVFMLMATAVAWLGKGFRPWVCCPLTILLVALSVWLNYMPKTIGQVAIRVAGFGFIGSLGWLFSIVRFGAYDAYNDTFGYLVQAQWLQTHSFGKLALISGQYPAFSQVFTFQLGGQRFAGSFLYSWIQATFGIDWSYIAYPAAILIPLCASAIALAGVAFFLVRKNRPICILGGLAVGTTLNGDCSGSEFGFFHQTFGIAFGFAFLSLLGMYFVHIKRYPKYTIGRVLPFALLLASVLFDYPEMSPFVVFGGFACLAGFCLRRELIPEILDFSLKLTVLTVLLLNGELIRIARALPHQAGAVAGTPVAWSSLQFLAHAAGFISGSWDGSHWAFGSQSLSEILVVLFVALSGYMLFTFRRRILMSGLLPSFVTASVMVVAFFYFRYGHSSPWPEGVGESWDEFKLSQWATIFVLLLLVCGSALAGQVGRVAKLAVFVWLIVWQGAGLFWNYRLADSRTASMRQETGYAEAPFEAYRQLREEAKFAGAEPIFLDLGGPHIKNRQIVAYFLEDHPLAGDWSDDGYLGPLPPAQQKIPLEPSMWVLSQSDAPLPKPNEQRIGRFSFESAANVGAVPISASGGFDQETDSSGSWHWTSHSLHYRFKIGSDKPLKMRAHFTYVSASADRSLRISIVDKDAHILKEFAMQTGWTAFVTEPFDVQGPEFTIDFESPQPAVHVNPDPRALAFLIKNLYLEVVN